MLDIFEVRQFSQNKTQFMVASNFFLIMSNKIGVSFREPHQ